VTGGQQLWRGPASACTCLSKLYMHCSEAEHTCPAAIGPDPRHSAGITAAGSPRPPAERWGLLYCCWGSRVPLGFRTGTSKHSPVSALLRT
jgi:hypothetical protein